MSQPKCNQCLDTIYSGICSICATKERHRILDGNFTDEELQNFCHNLSTSDKIKFFLGCRDYQKKLFGTCDVDEVISAIQEKDDLK